jgi:outer membrane protein insertion porin family
MTDRRNAADCSRRNDGDPSRCLRSRHAQVEPCPEPANLPPTTRPCSSGGMSIVAHPVNELIVPGETYDYHIKTPRTNSANKIFAPYSESSLIADFNALFRTGFLDNLWIEVIDEPYPNGVKAKHVVFHLEERSRVKAVDYIPKNPKDKLKVEVSKIESTLKERNYRGPARLVRRRIDDASREGRHPRAVLGEGYNDASVETTMTEVAGGPKLVNLEFTIDSGPKVQIAKVAFDGNKAFADGKLEGQMKENKPKGALGMITGAAPSGRQVRRRRVAGRGLLQDHGYVRVQVGSAADREDRGLEGRQDEWVRLRIPVDEGEKYKVGKIEITGDETIKHELIRPLFKLREGDEYSLKKMRKGIEKSKEIYGTFGFWQWQPEPELTFPGLNPETGRPDGPDPVPPVVNISIKMVEGKTGVREPHHVHRQHEHARQASIRREMRVAEGGVFNTEALKESVRRLNQLGYFKAFEGKEEEMQVTPTAGTDNQVDIKLKFEEQNRNQISFGAGVSQFDGFFGQLSYQTSNFLGRGETMGVSLQKGSQAKQVPGVVQRAVPVRPADHGRRRCVLARVQSSRCSTRRTPRA